MAKLWFQQICKTVSASSSLLCGAATDNGKFSGWELGLKRGKRGVCRGNGGGEGEKGKEGRGEEEIGRLDVHTGAAVVWARFVLGEILIPGKRPQTSEITNAKRHRPTR